MRQTSLVLSSPHHQVCHILPQKWVRLTRNNTHTRRVQDLSHFVPIWLTFGSNLPSLRNKKEITDDNVAGITTD